MKLNFTLLLFFVSLLAADAQNASIKGQLQEPNGEAVVFANLALYQSADSSLVKVETSDDSGIFNIRGIKAGNYYLVASFVGLSDLTKTNIQLTEDQQLDMGILQFASSSLELSEVTVTASRAMVEVKPDRTVFNVQGTINSVGADGLALLRKAPGVMVDNNDNITLLGRSGVLLYIDGKRLPLTGDDLSSFLQNLSAEQIDRIDIITNPGAKYEAEGNAGIIDIRLKKDKNHGTNGSVNGTFSQGERTRYRLNGSANYRNKKLNAFGNATYGQNNNFDLLRFQSTQNGLSLNERLDSERDATNYNIRLGTDFFLKENHTLGVLVSYNDISGLGTSVNRISLATQDKPDQIDSILIANDETDFGRTRNTYNVNYRFDNRKGRTLNIDLDYGRFQNDTKRFQPNQYFDASEQNLLTEINNRFLTNTDIDIYTATVDWEDNLLGGRLGAGSKFSRVVSDNSFLVFDVINDVDQQNNVNSNLFEYTENVYAGYLTYTRPINEKWNFSAGLRAEQTDATGDLMAFVDSLQEAPVDLNYLSWFPNAGLTWQVAPMHLLSLNYGRRINRPDYNVLNPFRNQLSQLSYERGNPRLNPEIVNNIELGYTLGYRYNFKLAYSRTTDQITRLIGPDEDDPRSSFISWDNLADQTIIGLNISAPIQIKKWWNAFFNISASHIDNQADYGEGAVVDVQAFNYVIYQQHTFDLPGGFKGEISGYYSSPGVWGGVFKYESNWSLDLGIQKKFFQDQLNVRLSGSDLFYQVGWDGVSSFDGLESAGSGRYDSRRVSLSISYSLGNQNVKSRRRKTGIESEAGRVGRN
ncbi:MAG: TonB-dependent receptor [Bacteroidota bacterium]